MPRHVLRSCKGHRFNRWLGAVIAIGLIAASTEAFAAELWKLVANSQIIASGRLSVPSERLAALKKAGKEDYVELLFQSERCLKGNCAAQSTIRYFSEDVPYSPQLQSLIELDGKDAIVFLVAVSESGSMQGVTFERLYFAGHTPEALRLSTEHEEQQIAAEVAAQSSALTGFSKTTSDPYFAKVKGLIDDFTKPAKQQAAFSELENLGDKAVPSMVALMDDRRDLAVPAITLKNKSPNAFEGLRHYGPRKVVDAIAALLNQITSESFGSIYNGGSEAERRAAVDGWRIFLAHQLSAHRQPAN